MTDNALVVFLKNARRGHVKTRVARTTGDDTALRIYQKLVAHTLRIAASIDATVYLYFAGGIDQEVVSRSPHTYVVREQRGADLGQRMERAFNDVLERHSSAVLIGSDCGELSRLHILDAFSALRTVGVVIGPAVDGGYYLIGKNRPTAGIFNGINWSTDKVRSATYRYLLENDINFFLLDTLNDVDTEQDWNALGWML